MYGEGQALLSTNQIMRSPEQGLEESANHRAL